LPRTLRVVGPGRVIYRGVLYELVERPRRVQRRRLRQAVAFYTDEERRIRPITPRQGRPVPRAEARIEPLQAPRPPPPTRERLTIDPLVREKYEEWLRQFHEDRARGSKRPMLPIGALQRYYETRKAAFIEAGGSPDAFDEGFDKVDMSVAVDGWRDLDSELRRHNIWARSQEEEIQRIREKAMEHEKREREIEKLIEQYERDIEAGLIK